jgi:hypothetical protein
VRTREPVPRCTNRKCGKPREEWPERRAHNVNALTCSDACRFVKKNERERVAIKAMRAGVRGMLMEIEKHSDDPEATLATLRSIVGMNDPRSYQERIR